MKKTLILTGVLLAITCSMAWAAGAGLNLGWASSTAVNDCPTSPASSANHNSLCNSSAGGTNLIGSIVAPPGLLSVVGESVIVDYQDNVAPLSPWWDASPGTCRGSSVLSLGMNFSPLADDGICNDLWSTNGSSAFSYQANTDNGGLPHPGMAKVSMVGAVATSLGQPWPAGTEWYSFILTILNAKTTGTIICAGCQDQVCFSFNYAQVNNDAAAGGTDAFLTGASTRQFASWNGGTQVPCPGPVPTKRATWGEVKSLYR